MVGRATCPELTQWQSFALGNLSATLAAELEAHLIECTRCVGTLEHAHRDDHVVALLRRGKGMVLPCHSSELVLVMDRLRPLRATLIPKLETRTGLADAATTWSFDDTDFDPPQLPDELGRIGVFRVLKPLGHGGMGDVYLAEDPRLGRQVALKVLRDGGARPGRAARFLNECRALARLEHPHIVKIFDTGEQRGRPWFVMEYVAGGTLADRLRGEPQVPRSAANLLQRIAAAIHFAHLQGIVHRDLKPANVLLEAGPTSGPHVAGGSTVDSEAGRNRSVASANPKVTDFGLAKPIEDVGQTQAGELLGTPAYMAPEATEGETLDGQQYVLLDVYSLGAILYELLTGRPPFRAATVLETLEQAREHEPIAPRRLVPSVPRDLETICLKCLAKDPKRRYVSAGALAEDLTRFLEGRPILARPASWSERAWKAVCRRPALAGVTAAACVLLVGGTMTHQVRMQWALERAESGEALARREQQRMQTQYRAARQALQTMLKSLEDRGLATTPRLRELQKTQWEAALAFYQSLGAIGADATSEMQADAAEAVFEAGRLQAFVGQYQAAAQSFREALTAFERLAEREPTEVRHRARVATCLYNLAIQLAAVGQPDESETLLRRSIAMRELLARDHPNVPEYLNDLAGGHHLLGTRLHLTRRDPSAAYETSAAMRLKLLQEHPNEVTARFGLADTYTNLSLVYQHAGQPERAVRTATEAKRLLSELSREFPERLDFRHSLGAAHLNLAYVFQRQSRYAETVAEATEAIAVLEQVLSREPMYNTARDNLLKAHGIMAQGLGALNRHREAVTHWDRAVELGRPDQKVLLRLQRLEALAKAGDHIRIGTEARELAPLSHGFEAITSHWMHVFVAAIEAVNADARLTACEKRVVCEMLAAQAAGILRDYLDARLVPASEASKLTPAKLLPLATVNPDFGELSQRLQGLAANATWFNP